MKITVVGAGNVGATVAENIVRRELAEEIVLLDIKEGFAEGKAMDMNQTATLNGFDSKVIGSTNDYGKTAGSTVAVITSGIPRKPGMTREELIGTNAKIVQMVTENLIKYSPDIIIVVISNPMDTMTYLTSKTSGLPKNRIIGMGGILDSARFKYRLSEQLGCSPNDIQGQVIGGHGDTTMIPLIEHATTIVCQLHSFNYRSTGIYSIRNYGWRKDLDRLIGTSAWYAPGAAGAELVESIVRNQKKMFPCSVLINGEYGQDDICIGVPVIIGSSGWEKVVEFNLSEDEKEKFEASAAAVRKMNAALEENL